MASRIDPDRSRARTLLAWLARELARGSAHDRLAEALAAEGLGDDDTVQVMATLRALPAMPAAEEFAARARQLGQILALQRRLSALEPASVPRETTLSADDLLARYFARNRPVVLTEMMAGWSCVTGWTDEALTDRFGDVEVDVCLGREGDDEPDRHFEAHTERMALGDFLARVSAAGESDDVYMIANNRNMERNALGGLLDDVTLPDCLDPARLDRCTSLWIGPAGTLTRAHHDTTSILFCQVRGRKRVHLAAPLELELLDTARDFYNRVDLAAPPAGVRVLEVDLVAGEALFIPVGWWHQVRALEPSINISFTGFRWPNRFDAYAPGLLTST